MVRILDGHHCRRLQPRGAFGYSYLYVIFFHFSYGAKATLYYPPPNHNHLSVDWWNNCLQCFVPSRVELRGQEELQLRIDFCILWTTQVELKWWKRYNYEWSVAWMASLVGGDVDHYPCCSYRMETASSFYCPQSPLWQLQWHHDHHLSHTIYWMFSDVPDPTWTFPNDRQLSSQGYQVFRHPRSEHEEEGGINNHHGTNRIILLLLIDKQLPRKQIPYVYRQIIGHCCWKTYLLALGGSCMIYSVQIIPIKFRDILANDRLLS